MLTFEKVHEVRAAHETAPALLTKTTSISGSVAFPAVPKPAGSPEKFMDTATPPIPQYHEEPLLIPATKRFVLFPIKFHKLWQAYKNAEAKFWSAEEVELSEDAEEWETFDKAEQVFIRKSVALLACNDDCIGENFINRFNNEIQSPEARCMFGFQIMQRNIHSELFHVLLDVITEGSEERSPLDIVNNFPSQLNKKDWIQKYMTQSEEHYSFRIIALSIYVSVFFSSIYASLLHLAGPPSANQECKLPGLIRGLSKMYRDHQLYYDFYRAVSRSMVNRPAAAKVYEMTREAVAIEHQLVDDLFGQSSVTLAGNAVDAQHVKTYVERCANRGLAGLEYDALYDVQSEEIAWISQILDEEAKKDESEMSAPTEMGGGDMHPNLPSKLQLGIDDFALNADF